MVVGKETAMPHVALDHVLFVLVALVSPLVDSLWLYPWLTRLSEAGVPGVRPRAYLVGILGQWIPLGLMLALWASRGRPWIGLGLGIGSPLRLGIGLALAVAVIGLLWLQSRAIAARPERYDLVLRQITSARPLVPHTPGELRGFQLLSITAGICEEVMYRGYIWWYLAVWTGPLAGAVISAVLFGAGHLYLDRKSAVKAGAVGAVMAAIVAGCGSLWPAMILHAAIDINSGGLTFRALKREQDRNPEPGISGRAEAA
jgi:membrane protease YdiL (CAAX protease family)